MAPPAVQFPDDMSLNATRLDGERLAEMAALMMPPPPPMKHRWGKFRGRSEVPAQTTNADATSASFRSANRRRSVQFAPLVGESWGSQGLFSGDLYSGVSTPIVGLAICQL